MEQVERRDPASNFEDRQSIDLPEIAKLFAIEFTIPVQEVSICRQIGPVTQGFSSVGSVLI